MPPAIQTEVQMLNSSRGLHRVASLDLRDVVRHCLQTSSYPCIRRLRCTYHEGVVTLHGRVDCYHLKQIAQEAVRHLVGVDEVVNRIEVVERAQE